MNTIKVGNGGAGIVGFVQYMYTTFNKSKNPKYPFEWITSDTEETLNGLADGSLDVGWPYAIKRVCDAYQEHLDSWTEPRYIFRDHFALVGPKSNIAGLPSSDDPHPHFSNDTVSAMFKTISEGKTGAKFLTRNDDSATNVLEKEIFRGVLGRDPEVGKDNWYIPLTGEDHYPDTALEQSNINGYYTLSDRGIWTWAEASKKSELKIFCEGGDTNPEDILLNACLALTPKNAPVEAIEFVDWLCGDGQEYVETFMLNGDRLYSKAPADNIYACRTIY